MLVFGGSLGSRRINEAAIEGLDGATIGSSTSPASATGRRCRSGRGGRAMTCASTSTASASRPRSRPATSSSPVRRIDLRDRRLRVARRSSCPTRPRAPATARQRRAGWNAPAARSCCSTPTARGQRLAAAVGATDRRPRSGSRGWRAASRALARPQAAGERGGARRGGGRAARERGPWTRAAASLRRRRRRRHERDARAAARTGRDVSGSDRARVGLFGGARAPTGCSSRRSGTAPRTCPAGEGVEVVCSTRDRGRERRARRGASSAGWRVLSRGAAARRADARFGGRSPSPARTARRRPAGMIVAALRAGGLDPGYLIGGMLRETRTKRRVARERVARRRGRRVGPLAARTPRRDRGAHQRRARPSRRLRLTAPSSRTSTALSSPARAQAVIWDRPELLALREGRVRAPTTPRARARPRLLAPSLEKG